MNFVELTVNSVPYLAVDSWLERGISHGFFGREVDFSEGTTNWGKISDIGNLKLLNQQHGKRIIKIGFGDEAEGERPEADGWLIKYDEAGGAAYGIRSADCFPVIITSRVQPVGAILHCGWRGATAGILVDTLVAMTRAGVGKKSIEIAIGPGILAENYEIGRDVEGELMRAYNFVNSPATGVPAPITTSEGRIGGDIQNLLMAQAVFCGVQLSNIVTAAAICASEPLRYFSHRRGDTGRQLSYISVEPGAFTPIKVG